MSTLRRCAAARTRFSTYPWGEMAAVAKAAVQPSRRGFFVDASGAPGLETPVGPFADNRIGILGQPKQLNSQVAVNDAKSFIFPLIVLSSFN